MSKSKFIVTVTYGDRWHLLRQSLISAIADGFDHAIIVDNGSINNIGKLSHDEFGDFASVETLGKNIGSAGGFKAGMQRALADGAEFILLLDDDNAIQPGCLNSLSAKHAILSKSIPEHSLSVIAYRSDRQSEIASGLPTGCMPGNPSAFFHFDLFDIPFKIFRRTSFGKRWIAKQPMLKEVTVAVAPYSGMYFHRSVLNKHGFPDERLVLYADDTDFSYRITKNGGKIILITDAVIHDIETSWNLTEKYTNRFDAMLIGDGDFRAFYSTRNNAYFEQQFSEHKNVRRSINKAIYLFILKTRAVMNNKQGRYKLLRRAIQDGENGRLGLNEMFPLQQAGKIDRNIGDSAPGSAEGR